MVEAITPKWSVTELNISNEVHVFPGGQAHTLIGRGCWCSPQVEPQDNNTVLVVHGFGHATFPIRAAKIE